MEESAIKAGIRDRRTDSRGLFRRTAHRLGDCGDSRTTEHSTHIHTHSHTLEQLCGDLIATQKGTRSRATVRGRVCLCGSVRTQAGAQARQGQCDGCMRFECRCPSPFVPLRSRSLTHARKSVPPRFDARACAVTSKRENSKRRKEMTHRETQIKGCEGVERGGGGRGTNSTTQQTQQQHRCVPLCGNIAAAGENRHSVPRCNRRPFAPRGTKGAIKKKDGPTLRARNPSCTPGMCPVCWFLLMVFAFFDSL